MQTFKDQLAAYLDGRNEAELATEIGVTQASVNRYKNGERFPDAKVAREIDRATGGFVPFATWQAEMMAKLGIAA